MATLQSWAAIGLLVGLTISSAAGGGVRVQWHKDAVLAFGRQICSTELPTLQLDRPADCLGPAAVFSARLDGTLTAPAPGPTQFAVKVGPGAAVRLWVDDHIIVDSSCDAPVGPPGADRSGALPGGCGPWEPVADASLFAGRDNVTHKMASGVHLRLEWLSHNGTVSVLWAAGGRPLEPIPTSALSPVISEPELWRQQLQGRLGVGWNSWMRESAARQLHLPSGFGADLQLWRSGRLFVNGLVDKCPDERECMVRPGHHSFNGSFSSFAQRVDQWNGSNAQRANVTISSGHLDRSGHSLVIRALPNQPAVQAGDLWLVVAPGFFFDCLAVNGSAGMPGHFLALCGSLTISNYSARTALVRARPTGLPELQLYVPGGLPSSDRRLPAGLAGLMPPNALAVRLDRPVYISAGEGLGAPLSDPEAAAVLEARERELVEGLDRRYPRSEVGRTRDAAEAMRTVIGWNTVWDQRVKVVTPVSRTFGVNPFIVWDWDTYFLSMMAAESDQALAASNLIMVTRGRTVNGQVPNAECAQWTNDDRSEPYVGALVLHQNWLKFNDLMLVRLLYDDLKTWNQWVLERRLLGPANLVSVGSDSVSTAPHDGHTKQAAIWETGMDNSPMYDAVSWDPARSKLLVYDVGMTSQYISECHALAELATALGNETDSEMFRARAAQMATRLQAQLWSDQAKIFLNYQVDTSAFNQHSSPTSFYPMLSGTATAEQARAMAIHWLLSPTGYCVGEMAGALNRSRCRYALPSTPASDPAYGDNSYWRGRVWGPLNLLVWLGLRHPLYANISEVATARRQLAVQGREALLVEWLAKHHVHENLSPDTGRGDDVSNSNPLYHWGATLALIDIWEAGKY